MQLSNDNLPEGSPFPMLIQYDDSEGTSLVSCPADLRSGTAFRVVQTNYQSDTILQTDEPLVSTGSP